MTSKASLLDEKAKGNVSTQEDKILDIISIGGDWSLKEIKAAYTAKWGDIETSSVSARCHSLKDPDDPKIFEVATRKCAISGKVINALSATKRENLGVWQAFVEGGKDKAEQIARYRTAPEAMKPQIRGHMETLTAIREAK